MYSKENRKKCSNNVASSIRLKNVVFYFLPGSLLYLKSYHSFLLYFGLKKTTCILQMVDQMHSIIYFHLKISCHFTVIFCFEVHNWIIWYHRLDALNSSSTWTRPMCSWWYLNHSVMFLVVNQVYILSFLPVVFFLFCWINEVLKSWRSLPLGFCNNKTCSLSFFR